MCMCVYIYIRSPVEIKSSFYDFSISFLCSTTINRVFQCSSICLNKTKSRILLRTLGILFFATGNAVWSTVEITIFREHGTIVKIIYYLPPLFIGRRKFRETAQEQGEFFARTFYPHSRCFVDYSYTHALYSLEEL